MITDSAAGMWTQVEFFKCQSGIARHENPKWLTTSMLQDLSPKQVLDRPPSTDLAVRRDVSFHYGKNGTDLCDASFTFRVDPEKCRSFYGI